MKSFRRNRTAFLKHNWRDLKKHSWSGYGWLCNHAPLQTLKDPACDSDARVAVGRKCAILVCVTGLGIAQYGLL